MPTRSKKSFFVLIFLLILINSGLCLSVYLDKKSINELAWEIAPPELTNRQAVQALTDYVHEHVEHRTLDEVKHMPLFQRWNYQYNFFRPGPKSVLEYGTHHIGPCQSNSRALRALLQARGIESTTVVMHDNDLRGIHSVLEVEYDGRRGIVSPTYGLLYMNRQNKPATIPELRGDHDLFLANALKGWQYGWGPEAKSHKLKIPVDQYVFDRAYYFNYFWFGPLRWKVFNGIRSTFGEDALFWLSRPSWYSYPALDYLLCIDMATLVGVAIYWFVRSRRKSVKSNSIDADMPFGLPTAKSLQLAGGYFKARPPH